MALNSSYYILVDAKLKTSTIQQQLNEISKNYRGITFNDTNKSAVQAASSIKNVNSQLSNTQSLWSQFTRIGTTLSMFRTMANTVEQIVQPVLDLDDALVQFKKVSDLSGAALDAFTEKAYSMGAVVAKTGSQMISAATEFRKNGFNDNDSLQLATIAEKFTNIADEEISAADSASFIISQMKAFNITAAQSEHIIDATNEVANQFSVGTGDLEKGLVAAGSALSTYGNSFEQTIGLVTSGTEIMTGKSAQVARGLKKC